MGEYATLAVDSGARSSADAAAPRPTHLRGCATSSTPIERGETPSIDEIVGQGRAAHELDLGRRGPMRAEPARRAPVDGPDRSERVTPTTVDRARLSYASAMPTLATDLDLPDLDWIDDPRSDHRRAAGGERDGRRRDRGSAATCSVTRSSSTTTSSRCCATSGGTARRARCSRCPGSTTRNGWRSRRRPRSSPPRVTSTPASAGWSARRSRPVTPMRSGRSCATVVNGLARPRSPSAGEPTSRRTSASRIRSRSSANCSARRQEDLAAVLRLGDRHLPDLQRQPAEDMPAIIRAQDELDAYISEPHRAAPRDTRRRPDLGD